jgi:hypothetical protein
MATRNFWRCTPAARPTFFSPVLTPTSCTSCLLQANRKIAAKIGTGKTTFWQSIRQLYQKLQFKV